MKFCVKLIRTPPRSQDLYGPFDDQWDAYGWGDDVVFTTLSGSLPGIGSEVTYEVLEHKGQKLHAPFETIDDDAPGDWR